MRSMENERRNTYEIRNQFSKYSTLSVAFGIRNNFSVIRKVDIPRES